MSDEQENKLYLEEITEFCHTEYQNKKCGECPDCSYGEHCPKNCEKCLEYIHFPDRAPKERQYDCPNMANFYVCKYSYKYTSEIVYILRNLNLLKNKKELSILSIGCGPCTELFAFDYMYKNEDYKYEKLTYYGIDLLKNVWCKIHNKIIENNDDLHDVNFIYSDAITGINTILELDSIPDVIVLNYLLSNMVNNTTETYTNNFIEKISELFNEKMKTNSLIIINDINLGNAYGGARDCFNNIFLKTINSRQARLHFINSNRENTYTYGHIHAHNSLIYNFPTILNCYSPYNSCSSAQLVIKKVSE